MATYTGFKKQVSNWQNYIAVSLLCLVSILISVFRIDNTGIGLVSYEGFGWVYFVIKVILPPVIGILILGTFRNQGIKEGFEDEDVSKAKKKWESYVIKDKKFRPRSLAQYKGSQRTWDILGKFTVFLLTSVLAVSMTIQTDIAGIIGLVFNFAMYVSMGFVTKGAAEEFVKLELVLWYEWDIERMETERKTADQIRQHLPIAIENLNESVDKYKQELLTADIRTATINLLDYLIKEGFDNGIEQDTSLDTQSNNELCR